MAKDLWDAIRGRAAAAHASGVMYRIESEPFFVEDGGVEFVVRRAIDYTGQAARMPRGRPGDPFADPEPELVVADITPTHFMLLNKYHVIESHLLVVTRRYVEQEVLLDLEDFDALVRCLPPDGAAIGFYNGGRGSGASQPHKHLQVVTLPLSPRADLPMAALIDAGRPLPFRHALARVDSRDPPRLLDRYRSLLDEVGIRALAHAGGERQSAPYNMLLARDWMMVVPRSRDNWLGVAVNSIGFAGALFVRHEEQLAALRRDGPMAILGQVA